jgi:hypothetical protein
MKKFTLLMLTVALFLIVNTGIAQTYYVKSGNGINLRQGPGTGHAVIMSIPQNGEVKVVRQVNSEWSEVTYKGSTGYVNTQNLSEEKSRTQNPGSNNQRTNNNNTQRNANNQRSSSSSSGYNGYTTAIGLRGGYTSGVSIKHFFSGNSAWELVLGSRWHGFSVTALYELHQGNALGVPGLTWEYGIGARAGFYDGRYYYKGKRGNCNDPHNPKCYNYYYNYGPGMTAWGLVGIGGLEYNFKEIPFTISLDLIPVVYLNHYNRGFMDGSISLRYILK